MNYKDKNGITLIALIVTILVLTIIAGISYTMITESGDIISEAENSTNMALEEQAAGESQRQNIYEEIVSTGENKSGAFEVTLECSRFDEITIIMQATPVYKYTNRIEKSYDENNIANYKFYIKESTQADGLYKQVEDVTGYTARTTIETGKEYNIKVMVIDKTGKTGVAETTIKT